MGFMPAHRSGDGSTWSLKEIVIVPGNSGPRARRAPGGCSPPRRRDRRAAGDPERFADHRDPHSRSLRRRDAGARTTRSAHGRDPRRRRAGALACRSDARRARRRRDPVVEPPGRRDRRGGARGRGRRVHVHERARADPPARVARTGHARERRRLEPPERPRAGHRDDGRVQPLRRPARVDAERVGRPAARRAGRGAHPRRARRGADRLASGPDATRRS